jgi:signal transduction histidine kinase
VRGYFDRAYHAAMLILVGGVFGTTATAITELTRSSPGNYFFAFYLIFFAFTALFPAEVGWILLTSGVITGSYVGGRVFRPGGLHLDTDLTQSLIYFGELTFIGTVLNRVVYRLFFDERLAQIELARANVSLRELDRAKSSFFSNISHEIRTPLTLILTPLTHLLQTRRGDLTPEQIATLEGVRGNANRLLKMVNSLLDFARLEAGQTRIHLTEFSMDDLTREMANLFRAAAESHGIRLVVEDQAGDLRVHSDLDKLEKILVNLLGNAVKFTPQGGQITLRCARSGKDFVLSVKDTGSGIDPQHHESVFERFTQLENSRQISTRGTGIGLAMVREYARLLGGQVTLDSELGKGSTFTVRLPISGPAGTAPVQVSGQEATSSPKLERDLILSDLATTREPPRSSIREVVKPGEHRARILVVDDNPGLVDLVASILEADYNLLVASDGEQALDCLARESVDLVVSDVMMPKVSGLELVKRMRANERTRHTPIILLTARGGTVQKVEGLETGADDYIGKPFDPDELRARVRSLFELRRTTVGLAEKSRELEAALEKLKDEELKVIESEKLRTLGDLAAGVFHELHNYLNIVCNGALPLKEGLADLNQRLEGKAKASEAETLTELAELAGVMVDAAVAARGVTGELKGYAHQDRSGISKVTDLNAVIQSTIRLFGQTHEGSIVLKLHDAPVAVECVPTRLTQVFTNLIKNALEVIGPEGKVEVETRIEGGTALATVTDNGPGVDPASLSKLFQPFHTTKKQGQGLGLGLSLSRKVMHDLGGELRYDASYRGGARFVVALPVGGLPRQSPSLVPPPSRAA